MQNTLREIIGDALEIVESTERRKWVYLWPGQVVICAGQTYWTACVENAIINNTLNGHYTTMLTQVYFNYHFFI